MPRGSRQRQHWTLLLTQLLTNDKKKEKKKKKDILKTLHLPHIVMVIEEDMAVKNLSHREERSLVKQPYVKLRQMEPMYIYTD